MEPTRVPRGASLACVPRAVLAACVLTLLAGCGGNEEPRAARAPEPVELKVDAPDDLAVVREGTVEVRGTVVPRNASVEVLGEPAAVSGGEFSATAPVQPGSNVIDVIATAEGRAPTMTAVRVTYELPVPVPDLEGLTVEEAEAEVDEAGLVLEVRYGGGLLEDLLPGDPGVCEQDPEPDTEVRRGTTVAVAVEKSC
jgi:hypothetical protein